MKADKQKGVSLIITFFIMIIILAVVLSISALLFSEIKIVRNFGNSVVAFYAADSGIEKVLYFDFQVFPTASDGVTLANRGLCSMYNQNYSYQRSSAFPTWTNTNACPDTSVPNIDQSIYCTPDPAFQTPQIYSDVVDHPDGCDPSVCDDCEISFSTTFDNRTYYTTAEVKPSLDGKTTDFQVQSKGIFAGAERQIKILNTAFQNQGAIEIKNACATPNSSPQGTTINISADITSTIGSTISPVTAVIYHYTYDSNGNILSTVIDTSPLPLSLQSGTLVSGHWYLPGGWSTTNMKAYYVDLDAKDTLATPNDQKCTKILSGYLCLKNCY